MAHVIILCPCCATPTDAEPHDDDLQDFDCLSCGQRWHMVVDARRHAEYALT